MRRYQTVRVSQILTWLFLSSSVFILFGCGFQLRGQIDLPQPIQTMQVTATDSTTAFFQELVLQLNANGVTVIPQASSGVASLNIQSERVYREALTISQDARVREYILYLEVHYDVVDADGQVLIRDDVMRASREYQFNEQAILGGQREEEFLTEDLSRQMAVQLVRRLAARLSSTGQNDT